MESPNTLHLLLIILPAFQLMAPSDGAQSRPRWDDRWASRERPESHLRPRWTEEPPPPSMLGPSPGGAEKFNVAAPKRSGNSEVPQVTGKGPDTSCSSQSVATVTLEAGRANSVCCQPSLKVITSLLLHQMFERRLANKPATFPTTRMQMTDGDQGRVLLIRFS